MRHRRMPDGCHVLCTDQGRHRGLPVVITRPPRKAAAHGLMTVNALRGFFGYSAVEHDGGISPLICPVEVAAGAGYENGPWKVCSTTSRQFWSTNWPNWARCI